MTTEADEPNQTAPTKAPLPTHWRRILLRTNKHMLFAEDLGPVGTKVDVEISDVKNEDGISKMPALSFANTKSGKRLALNKTNAKTMEKICDTPDPNLWRGWVTLVVVSTKIAGEPTDAIRIAPKRPAAKVKP
jgi:hypothetical protein